MSLSHVKSAYWANVSLKEYKNIQKWLKIIDQREAVIEGLKVPKENRAFFGEGDAEKMAESVKANADHLSSKRKQMIRINDDLRLCSVYVCKSFVNSDNLERGRSACLIMHFYMYIFNETHSLSFVTFLHFYSFW